MAKRIKCRNENEEKIHQIDQRLFDSHFKRNNMANEVYYFV